MKIRTDKQVVDMIVNALVAELSPVFSEFKEDIRRIQEDAKETFSSRNPESGNDFAVVETPTADR